MSLLSLFPLELEHLFGCIPSPSLPMLAIPVIYLIPNLSLASLILESVFAFLPPSTFMFAPHTHGFYASWKVASNLAFAAFTYSVSSEYGSCNFPD